MYLVTGYFLYSSDDPPHESMPDKNSSPGVELLRAVQGQADRRWDDGETTAYVSRLGGADYISLAALFAAWASALLFVSREPNWALLAMFVAYGFDKLDGFYARRFGEPSEFGRQLDSFVDVFVYLVTGALCFHFTVSPGAVASGVVGFLILAFGALRLIRHAAEGFGDDGDASYYVGITVVHVNMIVVVNYFLLELVPLWDPLFAAVTVAAAAPLQCSGYRSYKTLLGHALAGAGAVLAAGLALGLELGLVGGV